MKEAQKCLSYSELVIFQFMVCRNANIGIILSQIKIVELCLG